jgi:XTP/dITP diphosphohydrolase
MKTKKLIFASNNNHKLEELKAICSENLEITGLKEAGIEIEIEEPFYSLTENAKEKCRVISELTKKDCFSEDTGLEIEALQNEPGVRSARYAGFPVNPVANMELVLTKMKGISNRKARFRTVIALYQAGNYHFFEGTCNGKIAETARGTGGFGYDPIFIPTPYEITFSEMDKSLKNNISHRKQAFDKLFLFLNS